MAIEIVQIIGACLVAIFTYMAKTLHSIDKNLAVAVNKIETLEEKQQDHETRIRDLEVNL